MLKYAKSDIRDGLASLKIGVGNIIAAIIKGEITEYVLDIEVSPLIILYAIREIFGDIEYVCADGDLYMDIESTNIKISFYSEGIIFSKI